MSGENKVNGRLNLGGVIDRSALHKERTGLSPEEHAVRALYNDPTYKGLFDYKQKRIIEMNPDRVINSETIEIELLFTKDQQEELDKIDEVIKSHREFIVNSVIETYR